MAHQIDNPRQLMELPIIDALWHDDYMGGFLADFVPEPACSDEQKESVLIADDSDVAQHVRDYLGYLTSALKSDAPVVKIAHGGGGDFDFKTADDRFIHLRESSSMEDTFVIYRILQMLAFEVELEFIRQRRAQVRAAG